VLSPSLLPDDERLHVILRRGRTAIPSLARQRATMTLVATIQSIP
jgi:hypothetical protein